MAADAIQLTFLPKGITESEIKDTVLRNCPEVFPEDVQICVYEDRSATSAVITGFNFHYEKLLLKFRKITFHSSSTQNRCINVNVKLDTGEQRNHDGSFFQERPAAFRRKFEKLAGMTPRKVIGFLNEHTQKQLSPIFTGFQVVLYIANVLPENLFLHELEKPGLLSICKPFQRNKGTMLRYGSELETLQGILLLSHSNKVAMDNRPIFLQNIDLTKSASCKIIKGLGTNGVCIDIEGVVAKEGYVPFNLMDENILNGNFLNLVQTSLKCKRCDSHYVLKGVTIMLNSFAAMCSCLYDPNLTKSGEKAIFWVGENFTRLISTRSILPHLKNQTPAFCVQYQPVKRTYFSTEEYIQIQLPLLYEEWKTMSTDFKTTNTIVATIIDLNLISEPSNQGTEAYVIKMFTTVSSDVWAPGNPACVRKMTIEYGVDKDGKPQVRLKKVKLFSITRWENGLILTGRLSLNEQISPETGQVVVVIPKPNKSEYNGIKRALHKWNEDEDRELYPITKVLLNPSLPKCYWTLPDNIVENKLTRNLKDEILKKWMRSVCNTEQIQVVTNAMGSNISFIHGPPGTGKSFVLSVVVNLLHQLEKGRIVVTAPSNYAVDGIAAAILKNSPTTFPPPRVLRIYADSKEAYPVEPDYNPTRWYATLHGEVQRCDKWLNAEDCSDFAELVKGNKLAYLTDDQMMRYRAHKRKMESEIMNDYDVFLLTVGAFSDKRVETWGLKNKITTIIQDEAGQMQHCHTVSIYATKAERYIFAGDPEQLPPHSDSKASEYAGFNMSLIEAVYLSQDTNRTFTESVPWTTLLKQYRMHKDIRHLVSNLTYNNKLYGVASRTSLSDKELKSLTTKYERRVVLLNHREMEVSAGTSYANEGEAKIIVKTAKNLINLGVDSKKIVIITLYEGQRQLILKLLENSKLVVKVTNCDGFQGRESPIVFVSLVRANKDHDLGFASSQNRLNVALSRAQDFLFIACNLATFSLVKQQHWKRFCKLIKETASVVHQL